MTDIGPEGHTACTTFDIKTFFPTSDVDLKEVHKIIQKLVKKPTQTSYTKSQGHIKDHFDTLSLIRIFGTDRDESDALFIRQLNGELISNL